MSIIREIRERSFLTQQALAERAGTSRTRLSAYENGRTHPELDTIVRIADAAGQELAVVPRGTRAIAVRIAEVGRAVAAGDTAWALRLVAELVSLIRRGHIGIDALDADPGSAGDSRWDALVGGVAEMLCGEHAHPTPGWASAPTRVLGDPWFVTSLRSLRPSVFVTTPAALAARGVFLSADSLGSV